MSIWLNETERMRLRVSFRILPVCQGLQGCLLYLTADEVLVSGRGNADFIHFTPASDSMGSKVDRCRRLGSNLMASCLNDQPKVEQYPGEFMLSLIRRSFTPYFGGSLDTKSYKIRHIKGNE
ncbi:hypothetical protein HZ326_26267 [Fusarium oxysporum f. sp. albedinis]|nr:hypothetical protein HZ326_26267 [Fusarium oxysporum f. sp. albedinis]